MVHAFACLFHDLYTKQCSNANLMVQRLLFLALLSWPLTCPCKATHKYGEYTAGTRRFNPESSVCHDSEVASRRLCLPDEQKRGTSIPGAFQEGTATIPYISPAVSLLKGLVKRIGTPKEPDKFQGIPYKFLYRDSLSIPRGFPRNF